MGALDQRSEAGLLAKPVAAVEVAVVIEMIVDRE